MAVLEAAQETPPTNSSAVGACLCIYDSDASTLRVDCWHNVQNVSAAHIHGPAAVGQPGGVAIPFESAESPIRGTFNLTADQAQDLLAGQTYVNVHSGTRTIAPTPTQVRGHPDDVR